MLGLRRLPSPMKAFTFWAHVPSPPFSISRNSLFDLVCGRSGLFRFCRTHVCSKSEAHLLTFGRTLQKKVMHSLNLSGQKLFVGSFLGFSVATGLIYQQTNDIYAMDDDYADMEDPSRFLKDDLHTFWSLARKYQLPLVLLVTILLGWRHPFVLAINVAVLLFCTRPNPFSIYMFVEQLGQRDMRRKPSLQTKGLYVKKVEVEDYKILCIARVELRDMKMEVIGILGGWWVIQTSPAQRPQ